MIGIIITICGVTMFIYGLLITLGVIKTDTSKDSEVDKKLISEKDRYLLGRYNAGFQFIIAGVGAIVLGLAIYFGQ